MTGRRRAGAALVGVVGVVGALAGCHSSADRDGAVPVVALPTLPPAAVVPAAAPSDLAREPAWPTSRVDGGPRGDSSVSRLEVPGAPSYRDADDELLVPWAADFAGRVAALPHATPPPDPFRAESAPHLTAAAGRWAQITTAAEVDIGTAGPQTTSWTLYVDVADDRTLTSGDLLSASGQAWVTAEAQRLAPGRPLVRTTEGDLADARIQSDGSMLLPLGGAGRDRSLSVPADAVPSLLSAAGTEAAGDLTSGEAPVPAVARPAAVPATIALPRSPVGDPVRYVTPHQVLEGLPADDGAGGAVRAEDHRRAP